MKSKNIGFILLIIICLLGIALFNYKMDPFELFNPRQNLMLFQSPRDLIHLTLKMHKKEKYDYVICGGSTNTNMLNLPITKKKTAIVSINDICYPDIKDILVIFLNMHPEVKTIIFPVDYAAFMAAGEKTLPVYSSDKLNINDINKLLLATDTTKLSIKKFLHKISGQKEINHNHRPGMEVFPKRKYYSLFEKQEERTYLEGKILQELDEINNIAERRNAEIIYFIAPYNALFLAEIYNSPFYTCTKNIKRFLAQKNSKIIDMAFINKNTTQSLFDNTYFYRDVIHPSSLYGALAYDIIFDTANKDSDLYMEITKDNVETVLKKQENLLKEYIRTHKDIISEYESFDNRINSHDFNYSQMHYYDNMNSYESSIVSRYSSF